MKYPVQKLIDAINSDVSSIEASKSFNVPERTIRSHRQNKLIKIGAGRNRYLNDQQEDYLVSLFKLLPEYGFRITANVALQLSTDYFKSIGLSYKPGRKWLRLFVKRYRMEIKWKKEEKLENIRANKFSEETRQSWFSLLKATLVKLDLLDKPAQIFNCDETGFCDKTQRKHVIVTSTTRHVFEKNGGSGKQYTTALIGISAAGQVMSPFIIYSGKTLMNTWCRGGPDGSRYAVTKKGWIDSRSFEFWLREMFIPATKHLNRPLLLIMDGHNSHINVNIIQLLKQNRIVCLILPPHCTHGLQPIDVVLFNNVKTDWSSIVSNYLKSGNKTIKNADIPRLMKQLFIEKQAFSTTRIVSSFSRSGIWPFNENAMTDKVVATPFSSSSTLTIINTTPIPTNILILPTSASFAPSSSTTLSASPPITSLSSPPMNLSNIDRTNETLNSDIMTIDETSGRKDQVLFNIQQIKPIQPTYIDDDEIPSSSEATYAVLNTVDLNASVFQTETNSNQQSMTTNLQRTSPVLLPKSTKEQQHKKPVEAVDAVREVLVGLLQEQQLQQQSTTAPLTTTMRASRRSTRKKKINVIGIDTDQENDSNMDFESNIRAQLDLAINHTQLILDDQEPMDL
ncbi:unnamed protein product [Rotaria magnacalcarata]